MTKAEAIETVTTIGRHCRGPYRTAQQIKELHPSQRNPITETLTLAKAELELTDAEAEDPKFVVTTLLAEGQYDLANRLDTVMRATCGYNINDLIIEGGLDGEEHRQDCPWCGTSLGWRAPWFPDLVEDA